MVSKSFAITGAGPELLAAATPTHGAPEESDEDSAERRIEPDDGVRARPHEVARPAAGVVSVDHPGIAFDRAAHALLEEILWNERPVRTPRERVELDVRNAEPTR